MSCNNCNSGCSASCEGVRHVVEQAIYTMLQSGALQAGLLSCDNGRLSQDSQVLLCEQLVAMVQDGIDNNAISFPKAVSITSEGTIITVNYDDGSSLTYNAAPLLEVVPVVTAVDHEADGHVVVTMSNGTRVRSPNSVRASLVGLYKGCSGDDIAPGASLVTCEQQTLSFDSYDAEIKEFIETAYQETLADYRAPTLSDGVTLQGNGTEDDKLRLNQVWFSAWFKDNFTYKDCDGETIETFQRMVTCVNLQEALKALRLELLGTDVPLTQPMRMIPEGGSPGQVLTIAADGSLAWV